MTNTQLQAYFDSKTTNIAKVTTTSTDAEITTYVNAIFSAILDREPSATGLANISAAIKAGTFTELSFVDSAINADITSDAFSYLSTTESANAQAKQVTAKAAAEAATSTETGGGVAPTDPTDPTDPSTPATDEKQVIVLTDGRDNVTTGSNDDLIYGDAGQNQNGAIANAFSTGDMIDGGAGTDTLVTTIVGDNTVDDGNPLSITARVSNVEVAKFELIDEAVTVDAGKMDSVEEFWTDNSDATLTIDDVRLGTKLAITKDLTFGMKDVDFATGLTVNIDSASFKNSGDSKANSQVALKLIDATALSVDKPVGNVSVTLGFTVGGTAYVLKDIKSTDGTYEGLKSAIATDLALKGLTDLSVSLGASFTELTTGNNTTKALAGVTAKTVIITDGSGDPFTDVTFTQAAVTAVPTGFTVAGVAEAVDPQTSSALIETNLILDNAGRDSTAGNVTIGAMSNSNKGIEQFNVSVDHSSAISLLATTNNTLQNVVITSLENKGDLEINSITNLSTTVATTINASAFTGTNLMLGTTVENDTAATAIIDGTSVAINNLNTLSANIASNVSFFGSTTETAQKDDNGVYSYTTGSGADNITFTLDGDSVDASGESFALTTNAGNDTINMAMTGTTGVSQSTMKLLGNLTIDSGANNDSITINNYGNFNITAGAGSDTVVIDSVNANGDATVGSTTVGQASGTQTWGDLGRVLYNAKATVTFAGIESTVTVTTTSADNFVATQMTINDAIIAAIAASPELSKLVKATLVTGTEQLKIDSLVGGDNDLSIDVWQPQLISTGTATATQTLIASADVTDLRQGLLATETVVGTSSVLETAAEIVTWTNAAADFYGSIAQNGAGTNASLGRELAHNETGDESMAKLVADGAYAYLNDTTYGTDATTDVNFSTVNMGAGDNDVVVLHSNNLSMNTIKVDSTSAGKTTVVNFFDTAPSVADSTKANVGLHQLDFTSILNNQNDPSDKSGTNSDNADSATAIAVTLHDAANTYAGGGATATNDVIATANSVNVLHYNAATANSVSFAAFTAAQLKTKLNDQAAADSTVLGGLDHTSLTITEHGADLVGTTQNHIFMVENMANLGEYKVFSATSTLDSTDKTKLANADVDDFTTVVSLGTLDFGHSINFNLAGDATSKTMLANLIAATDDSTKTVTVDGVVKSVTTATSAAAATTTDATTVNLTQTAGTTVTAKSGATVNTSTIKTVDAAATLTTTATIAATMTGVTGAITVTGAPTVAEINTTAGQFSGVVTAATAVADNTAATLNSGTANLAATDAVLFDVNGTAAASDLIALDGKTATVIDATGVTTMTGTQTNVLAVYNSDQANAATALTETIDLTASAANITLSDSTLTAAQVNAVNAVLIGAGDITATVSDTAANLATLTTAAGGGTGDILTVAVTDSIDVLTANTINAKTDGLVTATVAGTTLAAFASLADTAATTGDNAYTFAALTDTAVADAATINTLDGKTSVAIDMSAMTTIGGTAAAIATALTSTGVTHAAATVTATVGAGAVDIVDIAKVNANADAAAVVATAATSITNSATTATTINLTDATVTWNTTTGITAITGGTGVDTITVPATQVTTITGGASVDAIDLTGAGAITTIVMNYSNLGTEADTVANFTANTDLMQFSLGALETAGTSGIAGFATNFVDLNDGSDATAALAVAVNSASAGATTVGAAAELIVKFGGTFATTDALETALEAGGSDAFAGVNAAVDAGDAFLIAYSDGTNAYIASAITSTGDNGAGGFAAGDLTINNLVQITGDAALATADYDDIAFIA